MVPFRNFLARKSGAFNGAQTENNNNENERPSTDSQRGTPLSVRTSSDNPEPPEYKLSGRAFVCDSPTASRFADWSTMRYSCR